MGLLNDATTRLEQLVALRDTLADAIDNCGSMRDLASLSKQYRETIREIDELEGDDGDGDAIATLIAKREAKGQAGAD